MQRIISDYPKHIVTNNAGPQRDTASPLAAIENVSKPESAVTFTLASTPVVTLAHFIPVDLQAAA